MSRPPTASPVNEVSHVCKASRVDRLAKLLCHKSSVPTALARPLFVFQLTDLLLGSPDAETGSLLPRLPITGRSMCVTAATPYHGRSAKRLGRYTPEGGCTMYVLRARVSRYAPPHATSPSGESMGWIAGEGGFTHPSFLEHGRRLWGNLIVDLPFY